MRTALIAAMVAFAAPALAGEASFDCGRAATPTEKAICDDGNSDVALRDVAMSKLYAELKAAGGHEDVLTRHGAWLKTRNACGSDRDCLRRSYDAQLCVLARAGGDDGAATGSYAYGTGDDEGFGSAFVVRGTDGNLSGEVESVTGPNAHVCGLEFEAALPFGDAWLWTDTDTEPDDEGNRCQVLFRVEDASTLRIDSRNCSLYCGVQGTFDAVYAREK